MSNAIYYRLIIRFTNGDAEKFVVSDPIDGGQITDKTRFAIVRTRRQDSDDMEQVFVASLADVSYIKTQRVEQKDMRHRVAGITGSIGFEEPGGLEAISTIQFV
jgi:hypothetical protein